MIHAQNVSLFFGSRKLFEDVNIKFSDGNCYGIIGANGAGKSTFLRILSGEQDPTSGRVDVSAGETLAVLKQDHFQYEAETVLNTVMMGNARLFAVMQEKDAIYAKPDFSEEDGHKAGELEIEFAALGGWEAETDVATLLKGLGLGDAFLHKYVRELNDDEKVKVLLAQALFAKPNNLLLDEPTNHLDDKSIRWLEDYLMALETTVIVISHDRHFLNKICTHMVDIDYGKAKLYVGNYDFWEQSSQLAMELRSAENKKKEDKAKDLEAFIQRFSANASKSRQATSRKKQLEKLTLEELPISTRKRPHVVFQQKREAGDIILEVSGISKSLDGKPVLQDVSFSLKRGDKALFVGDSEIAKSLLMQIIAGDVAPDQGQVRWGVTTVQAYLPKDQNPYFENKDCNLIDWLREFSEDKSDNFVRGFLGRMLFSGEETLKSCRVLSGGERVRCMLAKAMLQGPNVLILDGPTNHLDLESISAVNKAVAAFGGTVLLTTHDQTFAETVTTRVFELSKGKLLDHQMNYAEYIASSN